MILQTITVWTAIISKLIPPLKEVHNLKMFALNVVVNINMFRLRSYRQENMKTMKGKAIGDIIQRTG